MKNLFTAVAIAILIAFTGAAKAQEAAKMSAEQIQQATVSTQGSVPEGSIGPEATLWILLGIVFVTALATAGGGGGGSAPPVMEAITPM
jgi:hypothetical protein